MILSLSMPVQANSLLPSQNANQFGSTTVITGTFELIKYLNELEYMFTYLNFLGEQPITPDIEIKGTIVVPSFLLRLPDICQEKGCIPWVSFYQDQEENIPGVSGLYFARGGSYKRYPLIVLSNTRLRFRPVVFVTVNPFFTVQRRAILYIMQPSDHSCSPGQMKCERDQVCYEVNEQNPWETCPFCPYCLACLDLKSSQCACRDENGILPDGTPCRFRSAPDLVRMGECQSGECL